MSEFWSWLDAEALGWWLKRMAEAERTLEEVADAE